MVKIKIGKKESITELRSIENKLLMTSQGTVVMVTGVKTTLETETYGRRMNKTRQVRYLHCTLHGYNTKGDFRGTHDKQQTEHVIRMYGLYAIRRNYLDHIKALEAMQALEAKINEPDFVKAEPV